ncbi:universal stress protein [Microbacterium sp. RD1]|uniref:universal stress protein n=1 Tax=Microbacterium sp. RD1 TaxID=3457313 RepID=UPI003FA532F6
MAENAGATPEQQALDRADVPAGAVIAGVVPGQSPRVTIEAARYARLLSVPLAIVHVDVTRFVTFEDPDGYIHSAPVDLDIGGGDIDLAAVRADAERALTDCPVPWSVHQLVGDPALAIKHLADRIDAKLIVVGTRKRGLGESIREFFTGSVAARLTHRQHRPVLVIPLGDPVPDDEEIAWT